MNNRQLYIIAGVLCLIALTIFSYKRFALDYPLQPHTESDVWNIEVRARFDAHGKAVKLNMMLPKSSISHSVINEQFVSRGYGMNTRKNKQTGNRKLIWTTRKATGEQVLYYQTTIRPANLNNNGVIDKAPTIVDIKLTEAQLIVAQSILDDVRAHSADTESFTIELLKHLNKLYFSRDSDKEINTLLGKNTSNSSKLDTVVQIFALAKIPAQIVNGIKLQKLVRSANIIQWLEVYYLNQWHAYNPHTSEPQIPDNYFSWWKGNTPFIKLTGGDNQSSRISISLDKETAFSGMNQTDKNTPLLTEFSLMRLPLETQVIYHVLLPIPLAVFLLVLLRNVIGIKTLGTFMPVLIALAFRETQLGWGIMLFCFIVAIGLITRFYLDRLKLLLVARLASLFIIVIILMAIISILSHKMGLNRGLSIALFPMVILTMTIEHMTIVWEERGAKLALQQAAGSLFVAILAYPLLSLDFIQHFLFIYTETLLIILAMTLLLGRYTGYRLTELWRFKAISQGQN